MTSSTNTIDSTHDRLFRRLTVVTVVTVYLLIVAGGIVRSTGAGMGCPDWPKCFGSWIPPTEVSQLPLDYKEVYGAKLKGEVEFNATKTWIEYVNRLLGAVTGLLIFATLLASVPYRKKGRSNLFYASLAAFVLVGFQGWLGSKVVSSELHPVMVTLHMVVAIVIVFILLYLLARVYPRFSMDVIPTKSTGLKTIVAVVIALSFVQIVMGTQVREAVDIMAGKLGYGQRDIWIENLGIEFYIHRSFSILLLLSNAYLFHQIRKHLDRKTVSDILSRWIVGLVGLEIATGVTMAYFGIPALLQPVHLTLAVLLAGAQFLLYLSFSGKRIEVIETPQTSELYS